MRLRYCLSKKYTPVISSSHLLSKKDFDIKPGSKWDQNNLQVYFKSQVYFDRNSGIEIIAEKMNEYDKNGFWEEFLYDCQTWETQRRQEPWEYISGALTSKERVDIHSPGRIVVACQMVHGQIAPSVWLHDEWHESHGNDPLNRPGDYYFEADVFESGPTSIQNKKCVYFSLHNGESSSDRKIWNKRLNGDFSRKLNYYELQWNSGNFLWLLNGVVMMKKSIPIHNLAAPKIKITLGVTQEMQEEPRSWNIDEIYYQKL